MEMKEWIKEQQRRYLDEPRLKELTEVMKQTRVLVRKKEYRKLTELVRRYRKSEDVITQVSCLLSASYLFPTPEKTAETARSELMEALKDTYFMEKNGSRLMDIRPEETVPVHRMLAMYTFMQDVLLEGKSGKQAGTSVTARSAVICPDSGLPSERERHVGTLQPGRASYATFTVCGTQVRACG